MREVLVGEPHPGSEPVLAVGRPGPDVETVRWGFDGDAVHLVAQIGPAVRMVYFSNGPPPVEPPERPGVDERNEGEPLDASMLLLLLCD
jgi:hypothetical protein